MNRGKVKWFNNEKGYGFLTDDDSGKDVYVHFTNIKMNGYRSLTEHQRVTYTQTNGERGLAATEVVVY